MGATALRASSAANVAVNSLTPSFPRYINTLNRSLHYALTRSLIANILRLPTAARTSQPPHDDPQHTPQHHCRWLAELDVDLLPWNERQWLSRPWRWR